MVTQILVLSIIILIGFIFIIFPLETITTLLKDIKKELFEWIDKK